MTHSRIDSGLNRAKEHRFPRYLGWVGKTCSALLLTLVVAIALGEGLPSPASLTWVERVGFLFFFTMVVGLGVSLFSSVWGGATVLVGYLLFTGVEFSQNGDLFLGGAFPLFLMAGLIHLAVWWFGRKP